MTKLTLVNVFMIMKWIIMKNVILLNKSVLKICTGIMISVIVMMIICGQMLMKLLMLIVLKTVTILMVVIHSLMTILVVVKKVGLISKQMIQNTVKLYVHKNIWSLYIVIAGVKRVIQKIVMVIVK